MWPHRRQPTRLPCPWDSPGKNTGVGCHFFLQCMKVKSEREVAQSCLTLHDPMDYSSPGSSIHGIFQARVPEWIALLLCTSLWDECNCAVVWAFFSFAFLWDWNENWPFPVLWPLLSWGIGSPGRCPSRVHSGHRGNCQSTWAERPPLPSVGGGCGCASPAVGLCVARCCCCCFLSL